MNSDVASGRLKLASVLYAVGDFDSANGILSITEETYDTDLVAAVCECYTIPGPGFYYSERFKVYADNHNELSFTDITAPCVRFLPSEINCIPRELQYELFRSSQDDLLHRDQNDCWMDMAVVDSLPYLYFLQYKTYGYLRRPGDQQRALINLITIINKQDENFRHRETAWNLAGQCMMEQEDRYVEAFQCYVNSLNVRPRNNAANYHICRLLYRVMCNQNEQM
jgi:tetratricopeptide (TPR) repeat protein